MKRISWYHELLRISPYLIITAALGPYLGTGLGIRTDHVTIYPLCALALPIFLRDYRGLAISKTYRKIIWLWAAIATWSVCFSLLRYHQQPYTEMRLLISRGEKYIQPLAIAITMIAFLRLKKPAELPKVLANAIRLLFLLLVINAIIICLQALTTIDFQPVLSKFWQEVADKEMLAVATWAMMMGRFTGIFNQPVEVGMLYSLAVLLWTYAIVSKKQRLTLPQVIVLYLMFLAGLLAISKVFLIGGVLLFTIYSLSSKALRRMLLIFFILLPLMGLSIHALSSRWTGFEFFSSYFSGYNPDYIEVFSGMRFTGSAYEESFIVTRFREVWAEAPLAGTGIGSFSIVDNAYFEIFAQGGTIALIIYMSILLLLLWFSIRGALRKNEECRLLFFITILLLGAGMGAPVLTINRFSPIFWTLLPLLLEISKQNNAEA